MKRLHAAMLGLMLLLSTGAATIPRVHEVTYLGTVMSVTETTLQVRVIEERTQAESPMTFRITPQTQFFRGDHAMTAATVAIVVEERVAVTINNDIPGNTALIVRMPAH